MSSEDISTMKLIYSTFILALGLAFTTGASLDTFAKDDPKINYVVQIRVDFFSETRYCNGIMFANRSVLTAFECTVEYRPGDNNEEVVSYERMHVYYGMTTYGNTVYSPIGVKSMRRTRPTDDSTSGLAILELKDRPNPKAGIVPAKFVENWNTGAYWNYFRNGAVAIWLSLDIPEARALYLATVQQESCEGVANYWMIQKNLARCGQNDTLSRDWASEVGAPLVSLERSSSKYGKVTAVFVTGRRFFPGGDPRHLIFYRIDEYTYKAIHRYFFD